VVVPLDVAANGPVISGCSEASHRPALAMIVRTMARTLGESGEVACQHSTQAAHCGLVPSMPGALFRPVRTGGSQ
jgi:hypothetical protein